MNSNDMNFDEWYKCLEEFCEGLSNHLHTKYEEDEYGNPYGAGRYGRMRSSEDCTALFLGEEANYDPDYKLWYEYSGCGYGCEMDGIALQEADAIDLYQLHQEYPEMVCKESGFGLTYGNTRDDVSHMFLYLTERAGEMVRKFSFSLDEITMQEANEYIEAMEMWHRTGEFNVGPYHSTPKYGQWEKSSW